MVSKNKKWADGDVLYDHELNDNVLQPLSPMDATDNASATETGTSYVTKRTLAISAGAIQNFVIIRYNIRPWKTAIDNNPAGDTAKSQITIDSVQKFEIITQIGIRHYVVNADGGNNTNDQAVSPNRMCCFKYSPSSAEKTNGFTIDLDLAVGTGGRGIEATNDYWEVWGC